jgi:hypothetical protein
MILRWLPACGLAFISCKAFHGAERRPVIEYAACFGGGSKDVPAALAVDAVGHAFAVGSTYSEDFPVTAGPRNGRNWSAFITKLTPDAHAMVYSRIVGGRGATFATAVVLQEDGQLWVAGSTTALDFPVTPDARQTRFGGGTAGGAGDAFLALVSSDGREIRHATFLGGTGDEAVTALARDRYGHIWAVGWTTSHDFPVTPDALQMQFTGGGSCGFLANFDASGALLYATYLGNGENLAIRALAIDSKGNIVIAGATTSPAWPDTAPLGDTDGFVAKLDSTARSILVSKRLGGKQADQLVAIGLTGNDEIVAAGWTESKVIPELKGHRNGWIVYLAKDGSVRRNFAIGGSGFDEIHGIAIRRGGEVMLTGLTDSPDFPTTADAFRHRHATPTQAFLAKLMPQTGRLLFSSFLGTDANAEYGIQRGYGVTVSPQGDAYFFGETACIPGGQQFPATPGTLRTPQSNNSTDPYVVRVRLSSRSRN